MPIYALFTVIEHPQKYNLSVRGGGIIQRWVMGRVSGVWRGFMICSKPAVFIAALTMSGGQVWAQTANDTFAVTAQVIDACDITANDLDFGNYSSISASNLDASSSLDVMCTNGTSYAVALNEGTTGGGAFTARLMTDGSNTLSYNLYTSSARTSVWGDGTGATLTVSGTGSGALQSLPVYGRVPASQNVPVGSYADTVTATISF
jgi:spore coat protein U-like protein